MAQTQPTVLTAAQAAVASPQAVSNKAIVADVQAQLLNKGFVDGGPPDGNLGPDTKDEILAFRARNNLPLAPVIDDVLLKALQDAPPKEINAEQAAATPELVATRVEAVATTALVKHTSWWSRLWAYVIGLPSITFSILSFAIEHFGDTTNTIAPVRALFSELPYQWYLLAFGVIAGIFGYQAYRIKELSEKTERALVTGYQVGTVKNDAPPQI